MVHSSTRFFLFLFFILQVFCLQANDGAFFARGNQLIPIQEKDIKVTKEILKLTKLEDGMIEVSVYYEFDNPGAAKKVLVGFEAMSPEGDVDGTPKKGQHPYIHGFTVDLNGSKLPFAVAIVEKDGYIRDGKIASLDMKKYNGEKGGNYVDFDYVYHFDAHFQSGKNKIKHTYRYDVSGSIDYEFNFEYVLTAANRWGNQQIDDFTLILDMGNSTSFSMPKTFFGKASDWTITGVGKAVDMPAQDGLNDKPYVEFQVREGEIQFKKKNFKPAGELFVYKQRVIQNQEGAGAVKPFNVPFTHSEGQNCRVSKNPPKQQINRLYDQRYARMGAIFGDPILQRFYPI